jgi:hypothetical protein
MTLQRKQYSRYLSATRTPANAHVLIHPLAFSRKWQAIRVNTPASTSSSTENERKTASHRPIGLDNIRQRQRVYPLERPMHAVTSRVKKGVWAFNSPSL